MSRSDWPLNDPDVEDMASPRPEYPGYLSGRARDRQVMHLQVGLRYAWRPEVPREPAPLRLPSTAELAAAMGRVFQVFLALLGALACVTWSLVPLEFAVQVLAPVWCLFAVYATLRRGK